MDSKKYIQSRTGHNQIRVRAANGVKIGAQTDSALQKLLKHLSDIKGT